MLLDDCFMYDYGLVDATEEASEKKEVSDKMCEKALEVRAAELELEEAKANLKEANEALVGTAGEMREELQEEHKTATSIVIEAEKALKKLKEEFKSTLEAWKKVRGLGQGALEEAYEVKGHMNRLKYHSCSFVGNDVDRALDNHEEILRHVFSAYVMRHYKENNFAAVVVALEMYKKHLNLLKALKRVRSAVRRAKVLDPAERAEVRASCVAFGVLFCKSYPKRDVTPKLWALFFEVPRFADEHHCAGLMAEDPVESIHALLNRLSRTFAGMGNKTHREECLLRRVDVIRNRRAAAANALIDARRRRRPRSRQG